MGFIPDLLRTDFLDPRRHHGHHCRHKCAIPCCVISLSTMHATSRIRREGVDHIDQVCARRLPEPQFRPPRPDRPGPGSVKDCRVKTQPSSWMCVRVMRRRPPEAHAETATKDIVGRLDPPSSSSRWSAPPPDRRQSFTRRVLAAPTSSPPTTRPPSTRCATKVRPLTEGSQKSTGSHGKSSPAHGLSRWLGESGYGVVPEYEEVHVRSSA